MIPCRCGRQAIQRDLDFHAVEEDALLLLRSCEFVRAAILLEDALTSFPSQAIIIRPLLAAALCRLGRFDEAVATLTTGVNAGLWWSPACLRRAGLQVLLVRCDYLRVLEVGAVRSRGLVETGERTIVTRLATRQGRHERVLVAIHGAGRGAEPYSAHWAEAVRSGWTLSVPQSRYPYASGLYAWPSQDEVAAALADALAKLQIPANGRSTIVLGGYGHGASLVAEVALFNRAECLSGFISVMAAHTSLTRLADRIETATTLPDNGVRGAILVGELSPTLPAGEQLAQLLTGRGVPTKCFVVRGVSTRFPSTNQGVLRCALTFVGSRD